jgi:hypothetical protein
MAALEYSRNRQAKDSIATLYDARTVIAAGEKKQRRSASPARIRQVRL